MKKILIAAATSALLALPVIGWAHGSVGDPDHRSYWHDSQGVYATDSSGDCVKTTAWTKEAVVKGCTAEVAADSDGDGVTDTTDRCPDTPAGAPVDKFGCSLDSDQDGVPDYKDKCPKTTSGTTVDTNGCELVSAVMMEVNLNVNFATNSDAITSAYSSDFKRVADFMKKSPDASVRIEGHTDSAGSSAYNQDLSQRRADAVAARLINDYGIAADRVTAIGHSELRPVADNATRTGRAKNRRVVAVVKGVVDPI